MVCGGTAFCSWPTSKQHRLLDGCQRTTEPVACRLQCGVERAVVTFLQRTSAALTVDITAVGLCCMLLEADCMDASPW